MAIRTPTRPRGTPIRARRHQPTAHPRPRPRPGDPLAPARGIVVAILASLPLWAVIAWAATQVTARVT
jgi:hypothetical protein